MSENFWIKVEKSDNCWIWTGACNPKGYGRFKSKDYKTVLTHRISWIIHFGDIPDKLMVCHKCDNPSCVRPEHLFLGTGLDNARDRDKKGRRNYKKDVCKRGHNDWILRNNGQRRCNSCQKEYNQKPKMKKYLYHRDEQWNKDRNKRRRQRYNEFIESGGTRSDWNG